MSEFQTKWIGKEQYHKVRTGSTNADIRLLAGQGASDGTLVTAEEQTDGRGRRGRSWQAKSGSSLLFSILLRPGLQPDTAPQITLLMAMAVTKAIRETCGLDALIKWPNDVVAGGRKVCGILTEMDVSAGAIQHVIVGTGVNVNQTKIPEELTQSATSLFLELGKEVSKDELLAAILTAFENYYERFLQKGSLEDLREEYCSWLVSLDKEVKVLDPQGEYVGISRGINETGELLVDLPDGNTVNVYAGEVSVRGLYGYV